MVIQGGLLFLGLRAVRRRVDAGGVCIQVLHRGIGGGIESTSTSKTGYDQLARTMIVKRE